ncbi:LAETG motif-containing sortase-dependent surface protein [Streptomyces sp. PsTaAH-124]|uniref:LAETG motif-containing sortase-dependent surface protein n=1 Tax=Streptomyces sp. PsTaAH-124 TaxID=1157638 RepID=UPI00039C4654|nr:LAETG motif-containing sortase-dependent surface protein [Streptomyces sp. PsTaAH-124]
MKLRRALALAATTAAIAPLALLSAPTASAEEPTGTPSSSTSSASASASESAPTGGTTETTPSSGGTETTPSTGASDTTSPSGSASSSPSASASSSASSSASASASTSASPSKPAEPSAEPTPCTDDDVDADSQLTIAVSGLPGKIVAGSGWHPFKLTASNHSDRPLGQVQWLALVDNESMSENEKDWLSTYALLEYLNPATGKWESLADQVDNGIYFGETPLGPKQTVDISLRVNITAKAPAGDGYTVGLGGYVDQDKNCVHNAFDYYAFTVLKPGSPNGDPGDARPGNGDKPAGGKRPQGGAEVIPATGTLAETGSSSMVPVLGLVGGVAVVAGAGVVFAVRRRKGGAQA